MPNVFKSSNYQYDVDRLEFDIDGMTIDAINDLPHGAIKVDREGTIIFYNKIEGEISGRVPERVIGRNFFYEVAPCTNMPSFYGRFIDSVVSEQNQVSFTFVFDFRMRPVRVRIDMRPAREEGQYWIFVRPIEFLAGHSSTVQFDDDADAPTKVTSETIDTTLCDREVIHTPDAIQPHGALVAIDVTSLTVFAASRNLDEFTDEELNLVLGANAQTIFETCFLELLIEATKEKDTIDLGRVRLKNGRWLTYTAHRSDRLLIIELQFDVAGSISNGLLRDAGQGFPAAFFETVISAPISEFTAQVSARMIRDFTGYDRVLIYEFDDVGNGNVIAEDKATDWEQSLLGLNFPASDIPKQARSLYRRNRVRFTPNNAYIPISLSYAERKESAATIDLSLSSLRSIAPVHREYLDNLGVVSSFSASIVVDGALWGMVIGHHRTPRYLSWERLSVLERATELLGQRFAQMESHDALVMRIQHEAVHRAFLDQLAETDDLLAGIASGDLDLVKLFAHCTGAAVKIGDRVVLVGEAPQYEVVNRLISWLQAHATTDVWATDCLSGVIPELREAKSIASGVLVSFLTKSRNDLVMWFRPEAEEVTVWAGNPNDKQLKDGALLPRKRFEQWIELKSAHCRPWGAWKLELASKLTHAMTAVLSAQFVKLKTLNEKLEMAMSVKDRFLAQMSHEFRTPLNAILGFSELIASGLAGPTTPKQDDYLKDVTNAGSHLLSLITDILEMAKLEAGNYILERMPVDVSVIARTAIDILTPKAMREQVVLCCVCGDTIQVLGDERALMQILLNLLSNAIKYTKAGGLVKLTASEDSHDVILEIFDSGVGMDQKTLEALGTPFFQAQSAYMAASGTGLGISIVKALVKEHNGSVIFESDVDIGTKVTVRLPKN